MRGATKNEPPGEIPLGGRVYRVRREERHGEGERCGLRGGKTRDAGIEPVAFRSERQRFTRKAYVLTGSRPFGDSRLTTIW